MSRPLLAGVVLLVGGAAAFVTGPLPALASVTGTISVTGSLYLRATPSTSAAPVGRLGDRARIAIDCRVDGQYVRGRVRSTAQWDRLTSGRYVSHAYVVAGTARPCPVAARLPAAAPAVGPTGSMTQAQFIAASVDPARRSRQEYGVPVSVTIAQAILESGWGRSDLSMRDRNFFGMHCASQGPIATGCHPYATSECDAGGSCYRTTASFRVYASALDSFRDHGRLLATSSRYRRAFAYTADPDRFVVALREAGYATSPTYAADVQRVMQKHQLYRYDLR